MGLKHNDLNSIFVLFQDLYRCFDRLRFGNAQNDVYNDWKGATELLKDLGDQACGHADAGVLVHFNPTPGGWHAFHLIIFFLLDKAQIWGAERS